MKRIIMVSTFAMLIISCGSKIDEKKLSDYAAEVCTCTSEVKNQDEWNKCNEKRKSFFKTMKLDPENATANKYNDQMYSCLSKTDKS